MRACRDEAGRLERICEQLGSLRVPARPEAKRGAPPPPSAFEARLALLEFRRKELGLRQEQLAAQREALRVAEEELAALQARRAAEPERRNLRLHQLRKMAYVSLQAPDAGSARGEFRVELSYRVPGAQWAPAYSLHFEPQRSKAQLTMRAQVRQRSGEDWEGVRLTLSTADAMAWHELPELPSIRIGRRQDAPPSTGWRAPPEGAGALYADYDRARRRLLAASPELKRAPVPAVEPEPEPQVEPGFFQAADSPAMELEDEEEDTGSALEDVLMDRMLCEERPSAPPPLPQAAPMPMEAKAKRRAGPLSALAGAVSRSAAPRPRRRKLAPGPGAPAQHAAEAPLPGCQAPQDLMNYGALRMAGVDHPQRGKLRPAGAALIYQELLVSVNLQVSVAWLGAVERAGQRAAQQVPLPPGHQQPQDELSFDYAYQAEHPVDVPCDGEYHSLPLLRREAEVEQRYVTVPRESQEVFRFVTWKNPLQAPLLGGPADIYQGGDFLLTAPLRTVPPGGRGELGLGVEEAIRVARNTHFREHKSGLMGRQLSLEHQISIELRNNLSRAALLEVRERIPITREAEEEVQVQVADVEPPWEAWEQKNRPVKGAYRWQVELPAGRTTELRASYAVLIATKHELAGGNRREV